MNKVISTLLFVASFSYAMEEEKSFIKLDSSSVKHAEYLGNINLYFEKDCFVIEKDGNKTSVENYLLDSQLQSIVKSPSLVEKFQKFGYIKIKLIDDQFCLTSHVRGPGGGPALAVGVAGSSAGSIALLTAISVAFPPAAIPCIATAATIAAITPITTAISLFLGPI